MSPATQPIIARGVAAGSALTMNPQHYSSLATVATAWAYSGSDTQQPSRMIDFIRLARASIANGLAIRCIPGARAPLPIATLSA